MMGQNTLDYVEITLEQTNSGCKEVRWSANTGPTCYGYTLRPIN